MCRQRGLTLIELLVALALVAVLGALSWRGIGQMALASERVGAQLADLRELAGALQRLENDLLQIVTAGTANDVDDAGLRLVRRQLANGSITDLQLRTLGAGGIQRSTWRLRDGALEWLREDETDTAAGKGSAAPHSAAAPRRSTLLHKVRGLRWRVLASNGMALAWPPDGAANSLPRALEVSLDVDGLGTVERIYALR